MVSHDENGNPLRIIGINLNIHERNFAELIPKPPGNAGFSVTRWFGYKARKATDEMIEVVQTKSEFSGNMNHELRTPLNGIMSILNFMETTIVV